MRDESLPVVVLGWLDMLRAWFLRRVTIDGREATFDGWLPFRAFAYRGRAYYFRPWRPAPPGSYSVAEFRERLRRDAALLFLHEGFWHIVQDEPGHQESGIAAFSMIERRKTPSRDIDKAWQAFSKSIRTIEVRG